MKYNVIVLIQIGSSACRFTLVVHISFTRLMYFSETALLRVLPSVLCHGLLQVNEYTVRLLLTSLNFSCSSVSANQASN